VELVETKKPFKLKECVHIEHVKGELMNRAVNICVWWLAGDRCVSAKI